MKFKSHCLLSILIIIMLNIDTLIAQKSLNGFLNIPFGAKMETAKKLLLQKPGVKFIRQSDCSNLYFTGLSMGEYKADTCFLMESQQKGKFEASNLMFYSKTELLEEVYQLLCAQFGNPTNTRSEDNDVLYRWDFPVKGSKYKNSITLQNNSAADYFMLSYNGMGTLYPGWLQLYTQKTRNNADNTNY
jgi:hypothetical protein